jgi:Kef-type K+ transport system membrane component KefB
MNLLVVAFSVFILNLPFGYWRANVKKFSLQWILAIHIPVPFVIALRLLSGLGFQLITYPVLVGAFFAGQIAGKYIFNYRKNKLIFPLTSCLIWDIIKSLY